MMDDLVSREEVLRVLRHLRDNGEEAASKERLGRFQYRLLNDLIRRIEAIRSIPSQEGGEAKRDALLDSAYLAGMKRGWNCGVTDDREAYDDSVRGRAGYLSALSQEQEKS